MPDDSAPAISGVAYCRLGRSDRQVYGMVLVVSGQFLDGVSPFILFKYDKEPDQVKKPLFVTDTPDEHFDLRDMIRGFLCSVNRPPPGEPFKWC